MQILYNNANGTLKPEHRCLQDLVAGIVYGVDGELESMRHRLDNTVDAVSNLIEVLYTNKLIAEKDLEKILGVHNIAEVSVG